MAITPHYGYDHVQGKTWFNNTLLHNGPAELNPADVWELDMTLPFQGVNPNKHNIDTDYIVIPRGRIVAGTRRTMSALGLPKLTLADGLNNVPLGFSFEHVVSPSTANRPIQFPRHHRTGYIEVPFLQAINEVYGALNEGDYVAPYFGSATSTTLSAYEDVGKPVKWLEKKLYWQKQNSAVTATLASAIYPGIQPRVVAGFLTGAVVAVSSTTFNGSAWVVTFASAVTDIVYEYGHSTDQRCGQICRLYQVSSGQEVEGWMRWVEDTYNDRNMVPMSYNYPTTAVGFDASGNFVLGSAETPVAGSNPGEFTLANGKIAPHKNIVVYVVTGSVLNLDGTLTNVSGSNLGLRTGSYFENYSIGNQYRIDITTGKLYLSDTVLNPDGTNISASNLRVAYNYASRYEYGRSSIIGYGIGQRGLTDGQFTGLPGTPTHLERAASDRRFVNSAGQFGAMRIMFA